MGEATMPPNSLGDAPTYERIYAAVSQIPHGRVATYGQIASIVGECSARMVGYAMAALPPDTTVPWQRVINRLGKISPRTSGSGSAKQRQLLEVEGVRFDGQGRVDFDAVGWPGPDWEWLESVGMGPNRPSGRSDSGSSPKQSELDILW
jgi:methylated-DNA-protein-cysteine methyltransferase-like protein